MNFNSHERYKMTLRRWKEEVISIDDVIWNSSSDSTDKLGDDAMIPEPIGVSDTCKQDILYNTLKKKIDYEPPKLLLCAFNNGNDQRRRKNADVNRQNIIRTLKKNGFHNSCIGVRFFDEIGEHKFVASPEGNGIDCHRHWESLYFKSIPIVEYNEFMEKKLIGLPVLYTNDYSEITQDYLAKKYEEMIDKEYDFSSLILSCYKEESRNKIIRRGNWWCIYRRKYNENYYPIRFDNIFNNFYEKFSMITLTNYGYYNITLNCLASLKRLNIICPLKIYCIDDKSTSYLKDTFHDSTEIISLGNIFEEESSYCDENWSKVTLQKLFAIRIELDISPFVLFTDGDIVFEDSRFITYCYEKMLKDDTLDILCQTEYKLKGNNHENLQRSEICTGFMFIRSNEKTKRFFEVEGTYPNDQTYVNKHRNLINCELLPPELFPNGHYYYSKYKSGDTKPFMIHFNFVKLHQKKNRMQKYEKWYLN